MRILIASDSLKESLSALDAAKIIQRGPRKALLDTTFNLTPIGDGDEGTLKTLTDGLYPRRNGHIVTEAPGQPVEAHYATNGQLAVSEMTNICGLEKVSLDKRNPLTLTTKGVGEMIGHPVDLGIKEIMIGVDGSSTSDGGIGMAIELGYRFFDEFGQRVAAIGDNLGNITTISYKNYHWDLSQVELTTITDVASPLRGPNGAACVFSGQKGLTNEEFASVDKDMEQFYQSFSPVIPDLAGAGTGGGMAAGLTAFTGGRIISDVDTVLDMLNFNRQVQATDAVTVGEGYMNKQGLSERTPVGVVNRTPRGKLAIAICGSLKDDSPDFPVASIQTVFPIISSADSLRSTLVQAPQNLKHTA